MANEIHRGEAKKEVFKDSLHNSKVKNWSQLSREEFHIIRICFWQSQFLEGGSEEGCDVFLTFVM